MIVQELSGDSSNVAHRIVAVQDGNGLRGAPSYQQQNLFRDGLKQSLGKLELMTIILDSRHDGLDELRDIVC